MKFPHNTDAWANHLAMLATCSDQRDARVMSDLAKARQQSSNIPHPPRSWIRMHVMAFRGVETVSESPAVLRLQERLAGVRK